MYFVNDDISVQYKLHCLDAFSRENEEVFNRYSNIRLSISPLVSPAIVRSQIQCCALCRKIPGCRSINFRRQRSSIDDVNCVLMDISAVTLYMTLADPSWDWFYIEN